MGTKRFNRSNFIEDFNNGGIVEKDFDTNYFKHFQLNNTYKIHIIDGNFQGRPDLLSYFYYNTVDYWWIIGKVNNIDDWWNDIESGDELIIPDIRDIQDFYLNFKQR
jgi:hypothetical protein